ncbi:MAG: hypothetical protein BroJett005_06410 [Ignavibacteriota bacterium]|nr:hypothetical protein [Ignavibacteriaceae bacterium]GIK21227.1 MAG: hypothetical protein BroJett005_06410 [Ignavibacteriota bacterium]
MKIGMKIKRVKLIDLINIESSSVLMFDMFSENFGKRIVFIESDIIVTGNKAMFCAKFNADKPPTST